MIQVSSSPERLLAKQPRASQPGRLITAHRPSLLSRAATCSTASNLSLNPDRAYPPRRHDPRRRFRNQRRLTMLVRLFDDVTGADVALVVPGKVANTLPIMTGISNIVAGVDPTSANDSTQGYSVGSIWVNKNIGGTASYECIDATAGNAVWIYGGSKLGDPEPAGLTTQAGGAPRASGTVLGSFKEEGNIYRTSGLNIAGNGADTTDDIMLGL